MKSFFILVFGAVIGAAAMFFLASGVLTGVGAGVGIATGLKAGMCLTAEAAKDKGYITADQFGELFAAAGQKISSKPLANQAALSMSDAECQKIIGKLDQAPAKSK